MVCIFPSSLCMSIPKDKINPVAWLYSGLPDFPDFRKIYMASPRCAAEEKISTCRPAPPNERSTTASITLIIQLHILMNC